MKFTVNNIDEGGLIMLVNPLKIYTYKDYLTYDKNERIEIIEGEIINMIPTPSRIHQEIIS